MVKAIWNGKIIAETENDEEVEGNVYFPPESVKKEFLKKSEHKSVCHWKGEASYYDVVVNGEVNKNAAWVYENPSEAAKNIRGYFAFWNGVEIND